ncbi:MAG: hypothetical protein LLG01_14310 [Planctomycetaceae bacterium]|nr:hypothetical protein [Planctomycetaceae bacterium]
MSVAHYDENLLVEMLADGVPYATIAQAVGLTVSMVGKIARGDYRRKLSQRVEEIREARRQAARERAARRGAELMRAHVEQGLSGTGETARKCREFILNCLIQRDEDTADRLDALLGDYTQDAPAPARATAVVAQAAPDAPTPQAPEPKPVQEAKDTKDAKDAKDQRGEKPLGAAKDARSAADPARAVAKPARIFTRPQPGSPAAEAATRWRESQQGSRPSSP